jgi:hypothetical protein
MIITNRPCSSYDDTITVLSVYICEKYRVKDFWCLCVRVWWWCIYIFSLFISGV